MACNDARLNELVRQMHDALTRIAPHLDPSPREIAELLRVWDPSQMTRAEAVKAIKSIIEARRRAAKPSGRMAIFVMSGQNIAGAKFVIGEAWPDSARMPRRKGYVLSDAARVINISNRRLTAAQVHDLLKAARDANVRRTTALDFLMASENPETLIRYMQHPELLAKELQELGQEVSGKEPIETLMARLVQARVERTSADVVRAGRIAIVKNPNMLMGMLPDGPNAAHDAVMDYQARFEAELMRRAKIIHASRLRPKKGKQFSSSDIREAMTEIARTGRSKAPPLTPEEHNALLRSMAEFRPKRKDLGEAIRVAWQSGEAFDSYMRRLARIASTSLEAEIVASPQKDGSYTATIHFKAGDIDPIRSPGSFRTPEAAKIAALMALRRQLFSDIAARRSMTLIRSADMVSIANATGRADFGMALADLVVEATIDEAMVYLARSAMLGDAEAMRLYQKIYQSLDPMSALMYPYPSELSAEVSDLIAAFSSIDYGAEGWYLVRANTLTPDVLKTLKVTGEVVDIQNVAGPSVSNVNAVLSTLLTDVLAKIAPADMPPPRRSLTATDFVYAMQNYLRSGDASELLMFTRRDAEGNLQWDSRLISDILDNGRFGADGYLTSPVLYGADLKIGDVVHLHDRAGPFRTTAWPYHDDALVAQSAWQTPRQRPKGNPEPLINALNNVAEKILSLDPAQGPASLVRGAEADAMFWQKLVPEREPLTYDGKEVHPFEARAIRKQYLDASAEMSQAATHALRVIPEEPEFERIRARLGAFRSRARDALSEGGDNIDSARALYRSGLRVMDAAVQMLGKVGDQRLGQLADALANFNRTRLEDAAVLSEAREAFAEANRQNKEYIESVVAEASTDPVIQFLFESAQGVITPEVESKMALRIFQMSAALRAANVAAGTPFSPADIAAGWMVETVTTKADTQIPEEVKAAMPEGYRVPRTVVTLRSIAKPDLTLDVDTGALPDIEFLVATRRGPDGSLRGINIMNAGLGKLMKGSDMDPRIATELDEAVFRAGEIASRAFREGRLQELLTAADEHADVIFGRAMNDAAQALATVLQGDVPGMEGMTIYRVSHMASEGRADLVKYTVKDADGKIRRMSPETVAALKFAEAEIADIVESRTRLYLHAMQIKKLLPENFSEQVQWC